MFDGNISYRDASQNYFFISPTGVRKDFLYLHEVLRVHMPTKYATVTEACEQIHAAYVGEKLRPSGELPFHYGLLEKINTNQRFVVHVHATHIVAATYLNWPLHELGAEFGEMALTRVGVTVPLLPAQSTQLGEAVVDAFGLDSQGAPSVDVVAIRNHGVVSVADTMEGAWAHIERLNHVCEVLLLAKSAGSLTESCHTHAHTQGAAPQELT
jgi:ribulose-5-phosphate 4-epimerase/fuculose-1-phosphate aldolase